MSAIYKDELRSFFIFGSTLCFFATATDDISIPQIFCFYYIPVCSIYKMVKMTMMKNGSFLLDLKDG